MEDLDHVVHGVTDKNRFLRKWENCERDYDTSHHPNNYDCPGYKEIRVTTYNVYPKKEKYEKNKVKQDKEKLERFGKDNEEQKQYIKEKIEQ